MRSIAHKYDLATTARHSYTPSGSELIGVTYNDIFQDSKNSRTIPKVDRHVTGRFSHSAKTQYQAGSLGMGLSDLYSSDEVRLPID